MIHVLWNGLLSSALHSLSLIPIMTMIPVKWSSSYVAFQVLSIPWSTVVMTTQYLYHVPLREVKVLSVLAKKGVCCIFAAQTLARQCRVDTPKCLNLFSFPFWGILILILLESHLAPFGWWMTRVRQLATRLQRRVTRIPTLANHIYNVYNENTKTKTITMNIQPIANDNYNEHFIEPR